MTNKELIELNSVLDQVAHIRGKKFAYTVFKNKEIIKKEMEIFEKLQKEPHPQYPEYENERTMLCINYSKKDENGNAKTTVENKYDIEDLEGFQKEFDELKVKYKEVFDHMEETRKEMDEFLNDECKVELVKVSIDDLPDDVDANLLMNLKNIIE
jgi:hypothetical protein